jgi:hypothetical protein
MINMKVKVWDKNSIHYKEKGKKISENTYIYVSVFPTRKGGCQEIFPGLIGRAAQG